MDPEQRNHVVLIDAITGHPDTADQDVTAVDRHRTREDLDSIADPGGDIVLREHPGEIAATRAVLREREAAVTGTGLADVRYEAEHERHMLDDVVVDQIELQADAEDAPFAARLGQRARLAGLDAVRVERPREIAPGAISKGRCRTIGLKRAGNPEERLQIRRVLGDRRRWRHQRVERVQRVDCERAEVRDRVEIDRTRETAEHIRWRSAAEAPRPGIERSRPRLLERYVGAEHRAISRARHAQDHTVAVDDGYGDSRWRGQRAANLGASAVRDLDRIREQRLHFLGRERIRCVAAGRVGAVAGGKAVHIVLVDEHERVEVVAVGVQENARRRGADTRGCVTERRTVERRSTIVVAVHRDQCTVTGRNDVGEGGHGRCVSEQFEHADVGVAKGLADHRDHIAKTIDRRRKTHGAREGPELV